MKVNKKWMIILLPVLLNFSCEKFLDVSADSQVLQESMFAKSEGFHIAVNGVYRSLSSTDLYGKNLSWGFISAIGYNYEINTALPIEMRDGAAFLWGTANAQRITDQIWTKAFNTIANCNNIIQEVQKQDSSFFKHGTNEKNMILGEMYGLRAMLHFDLVRVFSPAPVTGFKGIAIPYVTSYPEYQPVHQNIENVFTHIIEDMEQAKRLLGPIDTLFLQSVNKSFTGRIRSATLTQSIKEGDFFNFRGERMNYFAATGLLARIYLYNEDYANAYKNAKKAYDIHKSGWFPWTKPANQGMTSDVDLIFTKRPEELFLTFSNNRNYDNWDAVTASGATNNTAFRMNNMSKLFENDLDDFRIVGWYNRYGQNRYLTWVKPRGTSANAKKILNDHGPLLPIIRFSEMYHILIECLNKEGNTTDAVTLLNDLRINRGAKMKISDQITPHALTEVLVNDIIRETLTEGQTFFMFKRLNRDIFNGESSRIMNPKDWFSPIPQSEHAYQL